MVHPMRVSPNAEAMVPARKWRVWRVGPTKFSWRLKLLVTVLAEYRRATAAARRYEELKLHRDSVVRRHNISRRIFEEFYARMDAVPNALFPTALAESDDAAMPALSCSSGRSHLLARAS
jgi:hypothetical protein